jgi:hypothetical protein
MSQPTFSPSINIVRDADRHLIYYPTENTRRIVSQVIADCHTGIRAFTLIGSYGTGKSAFLWAFEQNLLDKQPYFRDHLFGYGPTEVIRFLGEYKSLAQVIAERYNLTAEASSAEVLAALYYHHKTSLTTGRLVILIDEFGKFLEYAAAYDSSAAVYFIQELAEFVADPRHNAILVTTVHQNFDAYAFGLRRDQRQEWSKVKGRFREVTFNEPIEQLLRLAANYLGETKKSAFEEEAILRVVGLAKETKAFNLNPAYADEIADGLFPLDLFSANVLTSSLQIYGQNERSLFSFLESSDHTSMRVVMQKHIGRRRMESEVSFYHLGHVYDYLLFNFYSFIQSKYNPHYSAWSAIRGGLDQIDRTFSEHIHEYSLILKTIGLLNLTAAQGSKLDQKFLINYANVCLGILDAGPMVEALKRNGIIRYVAHTKRFILNNGTTLDVEAELIKVESKVERSNAIATLLKRYDDLPLVLAKAYTYETGTPRLFEFIITDRLRADIPTAESDGIIYLLFNTDLTTADVTSFSAQQTIQLNNSEVYRPLLYVHYENAPAITDLLYNLEKLQQVKADNADDKIAVSLLEESIEDDRRILNHLIIGQLFTGTAQLRWIYGGAVQTVRSKREFNQLLTKVCKSVYPCTPIFWNELVNKQRISSSIFTARRNYLKALVTNWDKPDLGFDKTKFPPEKTIYLTILKANGISTALGTRNRSHDDPNRFAALWESSEAFLNSAKIRRRPIADMYEMLTQPPFRLKQGFLDFWVPTFLFLRRDDYALFGEKGYVPELSDETLDLVIKYPDSYEIKAFDVEGMKLNLFNSYREFLQINSRETVDNKAFIETIRPFLTFYRKLPDYAKNSRNISKPALAIRIAIANSIDPEKTFFEDFPLALGFNVITLLESTEHLSAYIQAIEQAIRDIRSCYPELLNRFEHFIQHDVIGAKIPFVEYKPHLQERYARISHSILMPAQRVFIQRLNSTTTDRDAWLNALAQALLGRALEQSRDDDEAVLYERFRRMLNELDSLTNLSVDDVDPNLELALGVEINSLNGGVQKKLIRVPKSKEKDLRLLAKAIQEQILATTNDQELSKIVVAIALNELLKS